MAGEETKPDERSGPPDRTRRAVLALSAWTAVVAVAGLALSGTVVFWDTHDHLARATSGPAAVLTSDAVTLFLATVTGAALALPLLVAGERFDHPDTSTAATLVGAGVALAGPVTLAAAWGVLIAGLGSGLGGILLAVVGGSLLTMLAATGYCVEHVVRRVRGTPATDARGPSTSRSSGWPAGQRDPLPWTACCWNYWLVGALVVGAVGGGLVGAPLGGAVETWSGTPTASFDYETTETANGTRLTITHDRGDVVPAAGLRLTGNLTVVVGANQTSAGPWNGSTTRIEQTFRPGPHVAPGDAVAVGVPDDCVVRVVWAPPGGNTATLGKYTCEREEA